MERGFKRVAGTGVVGVEWGKTDARNTYPWIRRRGIGGRGGSGQLKVGVDPGVGGRGRGAGGTGF